MVHMLTFCEIASKKREEPLSEPVSSFDLMVHYGSKTAVILRFPYDCCRNQSIWEPCNEHKLSR